MSASQLQSRTAMKPITYEDASAQRRSRRRRRKCAASKKAPVCLSSLQNRLDASSIRNEAMRVETESVRVGGVVEAVTAEEGDDAAEAEAREGGTIAAEAPRQHHRRVGFWGGRHEECVKSKSGEARGPEGGKEGKKRERAVGWVAIRWSCGPGYSQSTIGLGLGQGLVGPELFGCLDSCGPIRLNAG